MRYLWCLEDHSASNDQLAVKNTEQADVLGKAVVKPLNLFDSVNRPKSMPTSQIGLEDLPEIDPSVRLHNLEIVADRFAEFRSPTFSQW